MHHDLQRSLWFADNRALCRIVHRHLGTACRALGRLPEAVGHEAETRRLEG